MRGRGIVNLLNADKKKGILLLEKLTPGKMLSTLIDDEIATTIAVDIMQKLWKPTTKIPSHHNFLTTQEWFERLNKSLKPSGLISSSIIDRAYKISNELHQSLGELVLLHGDLHHFNILSATRQPWLAIDPKGVIGEREYELGALLRNPIPNIVTTMNTKKILSNRVDQLCELLTFDRQKVIGWGFSQAVLAATWCVGSKAEEWKLFMRCAEVLAKIK